MTDTDDDKRDDIVLAGEYALGLMDAWERRAFEARLAEEPNLRALVRDWDEGLAPLAGEIAPVTPPRRLKAQIQARVHADSADAPARAGWLERLLSGALAAAALAILLITFVPMMLPGPPPGPVYQAEIAAEDGSLVVAARYDSDSNALSVQRLQGGAQPGRVLELWLIADGAAGPVSLGVLPEAARSSISLPEDLAGALAGATLAISDEPPGGSPTGQPTGAVLAAGQVSTL